MNSPLALAMLKTTTRRVGSAESSTLYSEAERSGPTRLNFDSLPSNEPWPIRKTNRMLFGVELRLERTRKCVSLPRLLHVPAVASAGFSVRTLICLLSNPISLREHGAQLRGPLFKLFRVFGLTTGAVDDHCKFIRIDRALLPRCLRTHSHCHEQERQCSDSPLLCAFMCLFVATN